MNQKFDLHWSPWRSVRIPSEPHISARRRALGLRGPTWSPYSLPSRLAEKPRFGCVAPNKHGTLRKRKRFLLGVLFMGFMQSLLKAIDAPSIASCRQACKARWWGWGCLRLRAQGCLVLLRVAEGCLGLYILLEEVAFGALEGSFSRLHT